MLYMNLLRLLPVILSTLLLAAHFYRAGLVVLVIIVLLSPLVLIIPKPWAARIIQATLVLGGIEWIRTLIELVRMRQTMGAPWMRLALILGIVALLTAASAFVFKLRPLRDRYGLYGNKR